MIKEQLNHLLDLFFPDLCPGCEDLHRPKHGILCPPCYAQINISETIESPYDNELLSKFDNYANLVSGLALFDMDVGSIEERLVYQIKYAGRQDIAEYLGSQLGGHLLAIHQLIPFDAIIPVPLHRAKLRKRGFNQSECLAVGIAQRLQIPIKTNTLIRVKNTKTQTKMSKNERQLNVERAFSLTNTESLNDKHVLLVDDVVTTGSTCEGCLNTLIQSTNVKLSLCCAGLPIDF